MKLRLQLLIESDTGEMVTTEEVTQLNQTSRKSDTQATAEAERGVCFFMACVTSAAS
jgi:hypothetical protein